MARRLFLIGVVTAALCVATPARAQIPVIDGAHLAQAILIAQRVQRHLDELRAQYRTIVRMGRALGAMDHYRIPEVGVARHDVARWSHATSLLNALNAGDAAGTAYLASVLPLERPGAPGDGLPSAARQTFERQYATIEMSDSVAMMAGHQVGALRVYQDVLRDAVREFEADVLSPLLQYHEMTAILDKIAGGELLSIRQDMAHNQLLSHALEQLLARGKRQAFVTTPSSDEIDVIVQNVSLSELTTVPYKATVAFQKVFYAPGTRHERARETHVAQIDFVLRDRVPNEFVRVNPLGLQIAYFRVDQAFQEARP